jgi:mRNA interferase RelE/StbE
MSDTIVIERAEYERLLEAAQELADLHAYDRAMSELAVGDEEAVPADYARRVIEGESPLRIFRELRGLTQEQLSTASGVNRVQIAEIERRRKTGSVATMKKLAATLRVAIDDLV